MSKWKHNMATSRVTRTYTPQNLYFNICPGLRAYLVLENVEVMLDILKWPFIPLWTSSVKIVQSLVVSAAMPMLHWLLLGIPLFNCWRCPYLYPPKLSLPTRLGRESLLSGERTPAQIYVKCIVSLAENSAFCLTAINKRVFKKGSASAAYRDWEERWS